MQIRTSRVVRNGKTYEYAQLVESFRRPSDGVPTHRVLANLSDLSTLQVANLKAAIAANREGKRVVVGRRERAVIARVVDNFEYLDIAVLLELWRGWGLPEILNEVLPSNQSEVSSADVVVALVLQRCVAPGSKLFATQWFPRTAFPELLGIAPNQFNNTRVHRVLDDLDVAGAGLMAKLPQRFRERDGAFTALFLDVTDTWFVGGGPGLAERGKTKEGFVRRKIGIVLLCNERGYPLRWEVVHGTSHDSKSMTKMVASISKLAWAKDAPVVCDRAMGKTAQIRQLATSGLRFVTALTTTEFPTYAQRLPRMEPAEDSARAAAAAAIVGGMEKVEDTLYVMDLGTYERVEASTQPDTVAEASPQRAMVLARQIDEWVSSGEHVSYAAAGRAAGLRSSVVAKYRHLRALDEDIKREIVDGKANHFSLGELLVIAKLPIERQWETFGQGPSRAKRQPLQQRAARKESSRPAEAFSVRVLAYFNPERFVEQRARARSRVQEIQDFVAELNESLAKSSRRTKDSVTAAVDRCLREHEMLEAFKSSISEHLDGSRTRYSVSLILDDHEWARRRRYDGFTVLVAHTSLKQTAAEICRLYRAKDAVEKDFQIIKSIVELRPVHHRSDAKVRAHVTLCMLALLLERTLRERLGDAGSPEAALERLATCHLNRLVLPDSSFYSLTQPTAEQRAILTRLNQAHLINDDVVEALSPR
jgi:hypothetical protein